MVSGGFIGQIYGEVDKSGKWVSAGIGRVRSDTPGVSQA
jgi:hypothetical protein